jgi:hypothetical protein
MGARPIGNGRVLSTTALRAYAVSLQLLLLLIAVSPFALHGFSTGATSPVLAAAAIAILGMVSCLFLRMAFTASDGRSLRNAGFLHLAATLAIPITLVVPGLDIATSLVIAGAFVLPLLGHAWLPDAIRWVLSPSSAASMPRGSAHG